MTSPGGKSVFMENVPRPTAGDFLLGVVTESTDSKPVVLTGGTRLEIEESEAEPGDIHFLRVESFSSTGYGPNSGTATVVEVDSYFEANTDLTTAIWYNSRNGWVPVDRGPVEHDLLAAVADSIDDSEELTINYPGFDPRAVVPLAIELLLQPATDGDIGLYSPGTQTHWGQKSDIREEFSRYGLSRTAAGTDMIRSIAEIFPSAYIGDGTIKTRDSAATSQRLVVSKDLEEFAEVEGPQYVIVNYLARRPEEAEENIETLRREYPDTTIVRLCSPMTKLERENAPVYGSPVDLPGDPITPTVETVRELTTPNELTLKQTSADWLEMYEPDPDADADPPIPPTATDLTGFGNPADIVISPVSAPKVKDDLSALFDEFKTFKDVEYHDAARRVFNVQMFFERLPIPLRLYDERIEERSLDGEIFLPKTSEEYVRELREHSIDGVGGSLLQATKAAEALQDLLRDTSPMFDELVATVENSLENSDRVAVFNASKKTGALLADALAEEADLDEIDLKERVDVVNSDSVRDIAPVDRLIFCGLQRRGQAMFYCHPRADEVVVLTYSAWMQGTVEDHVERTLGYIRSFLNRTEDQIPTPEVRKVSESDPEIDTDFPDPTTAKDTDDGPRDEQTEGDSTDQNRESLPDDLLTTDADRLKELARLAPTSNGELQEEWGLDSGSAVYQYLSSNLSSYYCRNENKRIVLTDRGHEIVETLDTQYS